MVSKKVVVTNKTGLHARPAAIWSLMFWLTASSFSGLFRKSFKDTV